VCKVDATPPQPLAVHPAHGEYRPQLDGHLEHGAQILVEEMEQLGSYDQVAGTGNGQEFS
jgi:hypothetical protein